MRSCLWLLFALVAMPAVAIAQDAQRAEARARFDRGIQLLNEEHYEAALAELERAYALSAAFQVLYNLGKVHAALGRAVDAVDALERYLREGGPRVPAARSTEVEALLAVQRLLIARVSVDVGVVGASIAVDGVDVARAPLVAPLRLTAGMHTLGAHAPGYEARTERVRLAGGVHETVNLDLRPIPTVPEPARLRIESALSGVRVVVDGEPVGTTPLDHTVVVGAGRHDVVGLRAGYLNARVPVDVVEGGEAVVRLPSTRNPSARPDELGQVRLRLPQASSSVRVDGEPFADVGRGLELPVGEHELVVDVADREQARVRVRVLPRDVLEVGPPLVWTRSARQRLLDAAEGRRVWGWSLVGAGAAVAATGAMAVLWNEGRVGELQEREAAYEQCLTSSSDCSSEMPGYSLSDEAEYIEYLDSSIFEWRLGSYSVAVAGLLLAAVGTALLLGADSDDEIDRAAQAGWLVPRVGPSSIGISAAFGFRFPPRSPGTWHRYRYSYTYPPAAAVNTAPPERTALGPP